MESELVGQIAGVCVGSVGEVGTGRRVFESAFIKEPLDGPVPLTTLGFAGDEHVYEDHGGPDMAVLLYPIEHYAYWAELGLDLPEVSAFAENLTVSGLVETDVNIGDVFRSRIARRSAPRRPCPPADLPAQKPLSQDRSPLRAQGPTGPWCNNRLHRLPRSSPDRRRGSRGRHPAACRTNQLDQRR